jgi:hypothetical protein
MSSWEWPTWFRWTVRVAAVLVVLFGTLILYGHSPVDSAGNAGIWFISELGGFRGGPEEAYNRLCASEQDRIGAEQFLETGGAEYAVLARAGAVGSATQYPDVHPLDKSIREWWKEYEITVGGRIETWRLYLVREDTWWPFDTEWKVCGIERRS